MSQLAEVVAEGYEIVCSCPTCGYMLKTVLRDGAYYSDAYQTAVGGDDRRMLIPNHPTTGGGLNNNGRGKKTAPLSVGLHSARETLTVTDTASKAEKTVPFRVIDKAIYGKILKDEGYFSFIDPLKRIAVAEHTRDLGEYLLELHRGGEMSTRFEPVTGRMVYYPPCHQREQGLGQPYPELLGLIPGISLQQFPSTFYCCGIAGIMGFKRNFHETSIRMGSRLVGRIKQLNPDTLVTDCLSCRLQFNQMSSYPVAHPVEILGKAYGV